MIEIKQRFENKILFTSTTAKTMKEAVLEAIKEKANLSWADLSSADLSEANLSEANLSETNLSWANLCSANLREANLREANLNKANLRRADLSSADLREANLIFCKMTKKIFEQITKEWLAWTITDEKAPK